MNDSNSVENEATNENIMFSSSEQLSSILRSTSREERIITDDGVIEKTDDMVAVVYNKDNYAQSDLHSKSLIIALQMEKSKLSAKGVSKNQKRVSNKN